MNAHRSAPFLATSVVSLAVFSATGCPRKQPRVELAPPGPRAAELTAAAQTPPSASLPAKPLPPAALTAASAAWDDIKDYPFEKRAEFVAGLNRLEKKLDFQIDELNAKRATLKTRTDEWDFAMKALETDRSYFKSLVTEASQATAETWNNDKEKIGRAWQSTQDAYDKVRTSTTL
jgi:hypothetical protein